MSTAAAAISRLMRWYLVDAEMTILADGFVTMECGSDRCFVVTADTGPTTIRRDGIAVAMIECDADLQPLPQDDDRVGTVVRLTEPLEVAVGAALYLGWRPGRDPRVTA